MPAKRKAKKPSWPFWIVFDANSDGDLIAFVYDYRQTDEILFVVRISSGSLLVLEEETRRRGKFPGVYYLGVTPAQIKRWHKTKKLPRGWEKAAAALAQADAACHKAIADSRKDED